MQKELNLGSKINRHTDKSFIIPDIKYENVWKP